MIVYIATNTANGKSYIGITRKTLSERMNGHKSGASGTRSNAAFHRAIRKYGWDSFVWSTLRECSTAEELKSAERELIALYGTNKTGYNMTEGGDGTSGYEITAEARAKIAQSVRNSNFLKYGLKRQKRLFHNRTGVPHTEETKRKISEAGKAMEFERRAFKIHPSQYPDIDARRKSGESFRKIGESLGVRAETVFYFCKRHGAN